MSVGKEGPSVHVASAIGHVIASSFSRFKRSQGQSTLSFVKTPTSVRLGEEDLVTDAPSLLDSQDEGDCNGCKCCRSRSSFRESNRRSSIFTRGSYLSRTQYPYRVVLSVREKQTGDDDQLADQNHVEKFLLRTRSKRRFIRTRISSSTLTLIGVDRRRARYRL